MAKKSHAYNDLSAKLCACGQHIKQRLADRFDKCYKCYQESLAANGKKVRVFKEPGVALDHVPTAHYKNPPRA